MCVFVCGGGGRGGMANMDKKMSKFLFFKSESSCASLDSRTNGKFKCTILPALVL